MTLKSEAFKSVQFWSIESLERHPESITSNQSKNTIPAWATEWQDKTVIMLLSLSRGGSWAVKTIIPAGVGWYLCGWIKHKLCHSTTIELK